jgi:Mg/Co/Ni transporter MgtE
MTAKEVLTNDISPLITSDSGIFALSMMEEFKVQHLPIVNNEELLGIINEEDVLNMSDPEAAIGSTFLSTSRVYIFEHQHIYDAAYLFFHHKLSLLPVVDVHQNYLGVIKADNLLNQLSSNLGLNQEGATLVLEMHPMDYNLGQIAQIIENNDLKILSVSIESHSEPNIINLIIKLNLSETERVKMALTRYGYNIKYTLHENKNDDTENLFSNFMKYLNI